MAGVIIEPIVGLQIGRSGMQTHLKPEWNMILSGMAIVFIFQMIRPAFGRVFKSSGKKRSLPVLTEPMRRGLIFLLIAIALVWPFTTGRAPVDFANLVLIYVMLGDRNCVV